MSLRGRLLVAEPTLVDPNFHRTVVYLVNHGDEGALGLILNRPGSLEVRAVVPDWAPYVSDPDHVFVGGPVSPEAAICLGRCPGAVESGLWQPIDGEIGAVDLHGDPSDAPAGITGLRVFAGYAGWEAGQLEAELTMDGWYVLDAEPDDVFTTRPDRLWATVLRRQPGQLRSISAFPDDPSQN